MPHFTTLTSPAVPLYQDNIDTDFIAPQSRNGPGAAFSALRFDQAGRRVPENLFDRPIFAQAAILIVGRNFGFGPRSADAVRALKDLGFACILGVSFAPVFADRAFNESLMAIMLDERSAFALAEEAMTGDALTIDLGSEAVVTAHGWRHPFFLPAATRLRYLALRKDRSESFHGRFADDGSAHLLYAAPA